MLIKKNTIAQHQGDISPNIAHKLWINTETYI